jgi:hypothetical protein
MKSSVVGYCIAISIVALTVGWSFSSFIMPKEKKSAADWERSFQELASRNDVGLKGKHPRQDEALKAKWDRIVNCPARINMNNSNKAMMQTTLFGERPTTTLCKI